MNQSVLAEIAKNLKNFKVSWTLGASSLLYFYNLVDLPNDIDIIVDGSEAAKAFQALEHLTESVSTDDGRGKYKTEYFIEMCIKNQPVDLIGGYKILRGNWYYTFPLVKETTKKKVFVKNEPVYLGAIEDWYVAYMIMGDPKGRTPLIEKYLKSLCGGHDRKILLKAWNQINEKASFEKEILERIQVWL